MAGGAGISGAVPTIVAEKMTVKTFGQRASRSGVTSFRLRKDLSRGREDSSAIGESDVLCTASRGMEKAWSSSSVSLSSGVEEFTGVGEERVVEGGGEDSLAESRGGIGRVKGER